VKKSELGKGIKGSPNSIYLTLLRKILKRKKIKIGICPINGRTYFKARKQQLCTKQNWDGKHVPFHEKKKTLKSSNCPNKPCPWNSWKENGSELKNQ